MEINVSRRVLRDKPVASLLFDCFQDCSDELQNATIFFDFPIYKDFDGEAVYVQALVAAPEYGLLVFAIDESRHDGVQILEELDQVITYIHSRLIRNSKLRAGRLQLLIPINYIFFSRDNDIDDQEIAVVKNAGQLKELLKRVQIQSPIGQETFSELMSTIDGSKGLMRHKPREKDVKKDSKGFFVKALEDEIALFDNRQRYGFVVPTDGPQRIRGIAGTGKTVVLAMKAAITHLKYPDARIVYTFYTKSLYQLVKRLITRFYRQFDDKDPDWNVVKVMHAWGGRSYPGVYYEACVQNGVQPLRFSDRQTEAYKKRTSVFDVVCSELKDSVKLKNIYDYLFVDEGQDFPASFIDLCRMITTKERIVWAYDELQNIFDIKVPSQEDVFGRNDDGTPKAKIVEDTILYKSYRNPREVLTTAHSLGFGIYSGKIVQMFENKEHWEDSGYEVFEGDCVAGQCTVVERPVETSTRTISENYPYNKIVSCLVFNDVNDEIQTIVNSIVEDIKNEGLRPDDILVAIVDDRHAKKYANDFEKYLLSESIPVNNTHRDSYGIVDFYLEGSVTISTVHKAKGNEAYQVYVVGVDALFSNPHMQNRNRLFTAMTRSKAWVTVSGIGDDATACANEIEKVAEKYPKVIFNYPSQQDIRIMRRDLSKAARKRQSAERAIDEALKMMTPEEIKAYLKQQKK